MIDNWAFYLAACPAVFLLGLSKGGFSGLGMVSLPLMALVVPPLQGAAIIMPILMVQDFVSIWAYRRNWDRRVLALFLPGAIAGLVIGALLARYVSDAMVELLVGLIATLFVALNWIRKVPKDMPPQKPRLVPGIIWGVLAGFTSFIANAGGVPFQAYTVPLRLPPPVYAGTATFLFVTINWIKFGLFLWLGQVTEGNLMTSATLLPLAVAATFLGVWIVRRIEVGRFYGIVTTVTFILGLKLIWDGIHGLAG